MRLTLFTLIAFFVAVVVLTTSLEPVPGGADAPPKPAMPAVPVRAAAAAPAPAPAPADDGAGALPPAPAPAAPPLAALDPEVRDAVLALRALGDFVSVTRAGPNGAADFEIVIVPRRIRVMFREAQGSTWLAGDITTEAFTGLLGRLSRLDLWTLPVEAGSGGATSFMAQSGERFWTNRPAGEVAVPRGPAGPATAFQKRNFGAVLDVIEAFAAEHATEPVTQDYFERAAGPLRRAGGAAAAGITFPTGG